MWRCVASTDDDNSEKNGPRLDAMRLWIAELAGMSSSSMWRKHANADCCNHHNTTYLVPTLVSVTILHCVSKKTSLKFFAATRESMLGFSPPDSYQLQKLGDGVSVSRVRTSLSESTTLIHQLLHQRAAEAGRLDDGHRHVWKQPQFVTCWQLAKQLVLSTQADKQLIIIILTITLITMFMALSSWWSHYRSSLNSPKPYLIWPNLHSEP